MADEKKTTNEETTNEETTNEETTNEEAELSPEMKAITDEMASIEKRRKAQQAAARKRLQTLKQKKVEQQHAEHVARLEDELRSVRDEKTVLEARVRELEAENASLKDKCDKQSDYIKQHTSAGQQRAQQTGQQR